MNKVSDKFRMCDCGGLLPVLQQAYNYWSSYKTCSKLIPILESCPTFIGNDKIHVMPVPVPPSCRLYHIISSQQNVKIFPFSFFPGVASLPHPQEGLSCLF